MTVDKEKAEINNAMYSIGWLSAMIKSLDEKDKAEALKHLDIIENFILSTLTNKKG